MNKEMSTYFDANGLIGHQYKEDHSKFDFGDSSAETGRYYFLRFMAARMGLVSSELFLEDKSKYLAAISKLEISPGTFVRHPEQYNEAKDYSRDQQTPIQLSLALAQAHEVLSRLLKRQIHDFPFYQNKDVITWEWTLYIRGLKKWFLYPFLLILDLGLLVNVVIRMIKAKLNPDDVADDLNLQCCLIFCRLELPTPISIFSKWLYRFKHLGAQYAWQHYYRHPENPPIDEVAYPVIRSYLWRK